MLEHTLPSDVADRIMSTARYCHTPSMAGRDRLATGLLCLLLLAPGCALAQSSPPSDDSQKYSSSSGDGNNKRSYFIPSKSIVIVILLSAFFFVGFSSIFIRNCAERNANGLAGHGEANGRMARARSWRQQGLKPEVLESFPTLVYSEVKKHKIGKGALECAVCLNEFENDERLRLLQGCNHAFHVECIDAWLSSHVTCPVCRFNLVDAANRQPDSSAPASGASRDAPIAFPSPSPEHVAVAIDQAVEEAEANEEQKQKEEAMELAELGSRQRESRARLGRQPTKLPRSHSTGHSDITRRPTASGESCEFGDPYTLRLPDHVMKEIFAARKFNRSASCVASLAEGEGSSRPGYRSGEGSSRGERTRGFWWSDRWPLFFVPTFSGKFPAWRRGGGGDGSEESLKKGDSEGSTTRGRFAVVMSPFECLSGSSANAADGMKAEGAAASVESESKSDTLARRV